MKIAIVGSVSLAGNPRAREALKWVFDSFHPTHVISGGAPGIDLMAALEARARGIACTEYFPENYQWAPRGFAARNLLIAQECEFLVRIVECNTRTYGSGWTRDRAEELGKRTTEIVVYPTHWEQGMERLPRRGRGAKKKVVE